MNDEAPNKDEARKRGLPEPLETVWFAVQRRIIWPVQDRFAADGSRPNRAQLIGGAALAAVAVVAVLAIATSGSGISAPTTTVSAAPPTREPLIATADSTSSEPKPEKQEPPRETLHGAAPVFSPPSPASKGGEKTGESKPAGKTTSTESAQSDSSAASSPTPDAARISSDPEKSTSSTTSESKTGDAADDPATAARAAVPDGPPAGPAALKVAREFAQGFVVYETGGEEAGFRDAFEAAATPQLAKALLQRPPKQPAGVKVPRAKVLNVVAGPSQGSVYKVSVSLLRVGVTSELRLDMEKVKTTGKSGKSAEWRVTNVLG